MDTFTAYLCGSRASTWAVSRPGEFIGTMHCPPEITTREFDIHGTQWLAELLN